MNIRDQLMADLKVALRAQDQLRKNAIRMAIAALKNAQVAKNADLTEEEMIVVLSREVKQRRDAIVEYKKGRRDDLVDEALGEIDILQQYLPRGLSRQEVTDMAREAIAETGASGPKQMGQVMRVLMPRVRGRADGRMVSEIVRDLLTSARD
jgi:uncharacterized protein YqeY